MLKIGHTVTHHGRNLGDAPISIPVPQELETVAGIPIHYKDVDYYSREYPLDTLNIEERASRDWANRIRDQHEEMGEIRREHEKLNRSVIQMSRITGEIEPMLAPQSGKDVTEEIRTRAPRRAARRRPHPRR